MTNISDAALDQIAADIAASIEAWFPLGIRERHVRPHVAGLLRAVMATADNDERTTP